MKKGRSLNFSDAITLEAWIKLEGSEGALRVINNIRDDDLGYFTMIFNGYFSFDVVNSQGKNFPVSAEYTAPDEWHHVVVTLSSATGNISLYIDGNEKDSRDDFTGAMRITETPLHIGGEAHTTRLFKGIIDEVRIYNRALSKSEVVGNYRLVKK